MKKRRGIDAAALFFLMRCAALVRCDFARPYSTAVALKKLGLARSCDFVKAILKRVKPGGG